ncbi:IS66 family insertion sequence transposase domain-containing protein [Rhizobium gallicum]|uniref:IS66 family insertion sequence transposase domain-containing protein n=1 Tax=Rhizobium gallicum TaxID=56730 RepID=A0A1L5NHI8_9HYPH|nr:IS66 family insertion sequence transposase domain-containing protein [Rhizobium gallicum]
MGSKACEYRSVRLGDWVKIKCLQSDNFVIVGYELSTVARAGIGSLCFRHGCGSRRLHGEATLIITAKFNDIDPQAWLDDGAARIADHPFSKIDEHLPWNWKAKSAAIAAAA